MQKKIKLILYKRNSSSYIKYLRKEGVKVGYNCIFRHPRSIRIDVSRPHLVSIGDNVDMNMNFQILTHDWACSVFRNKYHDFVNSSGKVTIGNNIYFGTNVCVLKGVSIGDNCVIGAYSLVTKDIPANSVAAGVPCKVVCTLDEYYEKRKGLALSEAVECVKSFIECFGREPIPAELYEEFPYFVDKDNIMDYPDVPVKFQLGEGFDDWIKNHKRQFETYQDFLNYCKCH